MASVLNILGLSALHSSDPSAPAGAPLVWTVLAFVRRELAGFVSNGDLSADPVQIKQSLAGVITGSINLTNPYSDPVKYSVRDQPANGNVVINADGTYTYTPDATTQLAGGVDNFTVAVRDTGFHLFGGSVITVPVSVAVTPPNASIANPEGTGAKSVVRSGDGQRAFVVNADNTISVIDTKSGSATENQIVDVIRVATAVTDPGTGVETTFVPTVTALTTDSTGSKIYLTTNATYQPSDTSTAPFDVNRLTRIDITPGESGGFTNSVVGAIDIGSGATALATSPDGTRLYLLSIDGTATKVGTVSLIDPDEIINTGANPGAVLDQVAVGNGGSAIAVDARGLVYVANTSDDTVSIIDPTTKATVTVAVGGQPDAIAFGPGPGGTGSRAYVANFLSNSVSVINTDPADAAYGTVLQNITTGGEPSAIAVSADGSHVYVAESYTDSVAVIDSATGIVTTRLSTTSKGTPTGIVLSQDGAHALVTNLYSSTIDYVSLTPTRNPGQSATPLPPLGSTKGFKVYNFSGEAATLGGYYGNGKLESPAPGPGVVVAPGSYIDFEVIVYSGKNNTVQPYFYLPQPNGGPISTVLSVVLKNVNVTRHIATCGKGDGEQCKAIPGYKVALLDPPGTEITLDATQAGQAQQIAETLRDLCRDGSSATCDFNVDPNRQQILLTKPQIVGGVQYNNTTAPVPVTNSYSSAKSQTNSIAFEVSGQFTLIKDKINLGIKATYGHVWTNTYTFTHSVNYQVPVHYYGWVDAQVPVFRDWGNFTVNLGNTVWHLNNVYFDTPDTSGNGWWIPTTSPSPPPSNAPEAV